MTTSKTWKIFSSFEDQATAEAVAETLRAEGVPSRVEVDSPVPGVVEDVRVMVSADLAHRAKWIFKSNQVTDSELRFAATGELGDADNGGN